MKKKENISNLACPFCGKTLTAEDFGNGKWQCRNKNCGKLFTYELWVKFCGQEEKWDLLEKAIK